MKEVRRPLSIELMVAGIREDWRPKGETPERTLCRGIHAVSRRRLENGGPHAPVQMSDGHWAGRSGGSRAIVRTEALMRRLTGRTLQP
jgi:hypothetical protein